MNKQQMCTMFTNMRETTLTNLQILENAERSEFDDRQRKDIITIRKKQLETLAMLDALIRNYKSV